MAIPGPGVAISMNTIATEFGGTVPHSLSEYYRGGGLVPNTPGNLGIPTSGQIAIGNFYGSANRTAIALTISSNSYNYDVYTVASASPLYVAGISDITVTVNPGVIVGSTATPTYAMLVPSAFNPGDTVTIVNNGTIQGMGGNGGNGGNPGGSNVSVPGYAGAVGGNAIYVNRTTTITNNGAVIGGGGGGGGGAGRYYTLPSPLGPLVYRKGGGGGGGGAGYNAGAGGAGGAGANSVYSGSPGASGTQTSGGAGGAGNSAGPSNPAGPGGSGGGQGASGANGTATNVPGGAGGTAGNYIVGNPFVTWPVTGTRLGGVA